MSEDKKHKSKRNRVEKHRASDKKDKEKDGKGTVQQMKTAEAAFSLFADDTAANPALTALFAAQVRESRAIGIQNGH